MAMAIVHNVQQQLIQIAGNLTAVINQRDEVSPSNTQSLIIILLCL